VICSKHLKNNDIYKIMSRKQKKHDLIDDFRPIIQKHKEEDNYLSRLDMCMIISKELGISLKVLCNLIPNELSSKFCKGFKKDGTPCTARSKFNGMCGSHIDQPQLMSPIEMTPKNNEGIRHTHSLTECIFKPGCPACETSRKSFRELRGLL